MLSSIYRRRMPRYGVRRRTATRRERRGEPMRTLDVGGWAGATTRTPTRVEARLARASIAPETDPTAPVEEAEIDFVEADDATASIDWVGLKAAGHPRHRSDTDQEAVRRIAAPLCTRALRPDASWRDRTVLFTSAARDDASAIATLTVALALAADHSVVLVDGDTERRQISTWCGVTSRPGLSDALADAPPELERLLVPTEIDRLAVLAAGSPRRDLAILLARPSSAAVMPALAAEGRGRLVLIGGPPLSRLDGRALALFAGQLVLVVQAGETTRAAVEAALDRLADRAHRYLLLSGAVRTQAPGDA